MSDSSTRPAAVREVLPAKKYKHFALVAAARDYWRATVVFFVVIVANAIVQAVLTGPRIIPDAGNIGFLILALISYAVMVVALGLMMSTALQVADGPVSFGAAWSKLAPHFWRFVAWTVVWTVVVFIGMLIYVVPGWILLIVTPYVLLAAIDGHANPLATNFRAIKDRPGKFTLTIIVTMFFGFWLYVASGLSSFLVNGIWGSLLAWIIIGFVGTWLVVGWALIYRSTSVSTADNPS